MTKKALLKERALSRRTRAVGERNQAFIEIRRVASGVHLSESLCFWSGNGSEVARTTN